MNGFPPGTVAVVNAAGQNVLDPLSRWNPAFKKLVVDSRVNTAKAISNVIQGTPDELKPEVFVQITGVGIYPADGGKVVHDEGQKGAQSDDFFVKLVQDWENAAKLPEDCKTRQAKLHHLK